MKVFQGVGLKTHKWNNNILSVVMLGVLPLTLVGLVTSLIFFSFVIFPESYLLTASIEEMATEVPSLLEYGKAAFQLTLDWSHIILLVVFYWYVTAWVFGDNIIRTATGSMRSFRKDEPRLYNLVENLAISKGMEMPKLSIIETDALNSFATGISTKSYGITVTRGLLYELDDQELEAVLAHEISHIENNDVRLMMVITLFAGLFETILALLSSFFLPERSKSSRHESDLNGMSLKHDYGDGHGNANAGMMFIGAPSLLLVGVVALLSVFAMVGSLISKAVKAYVSRRREFVADIGATELTHNPEALVRALLKIEGRSVMRAMPKNMAGMCIASPLKQGMFLAHPPVGERVGSIQSLVGYEMDEADLELKTPKVNISRKPVKKPLSWDDFIIKTAPMAGKMKAEDYPEVYLNTGTNSRKDKTEKPSAENVRKRLVEDLHLGIVGTAVLAANGGKGALKKMGQKAAQARKSFGQRVRKAVEK